MRKLFNSIFALLLVLVMAPTTNAQINYTNKERLNEGWEFIRQDLGSVWEAVRPAKKGSSESVPIWSKVTLPHCFNAEDAVDPDVNYYQGPGWYRKNLEINNPYKNGRILLHFEGAGQKTEVYIYNNKVGSHIGGYDEWTVDITDEVYQFLNSNEAKRFKGQVPLSIRSDNTRDTEMMPSDLSDFNIYGGIYRYLNLVYVPNIALDGIHTEASVDNKGKKGKLLITANVKDYFKNYSVQFGAPKKEEPTIEIITKIFDADGILVKTGTIKSTLSKLKSEIFSTEISKPKLWSPSRPNLYSCEITLKSDAGEMVCKENFGFRNFEFKVKGPFFLNGKRLLLNGTHRHEDHAGLGAAMTEDLIIKEMKMMKDMGVNFIRLGHYQQSRIVLEQCDKLGLLVWEEIPWCRGGLGGKEYQEQGKRMLTNMITQHRNHPSVILWGMGNENDWPNDFPEFDKEKIRVYMKELHDLSHKLDDTRLTSIRRCDFCKDIIDVYSPSIWAGWYRGVYTDYKKISYNEMQKTNHFLHVEWGGDSHAGRHAENTYKGLDAIKRSNVADERDGDASLYGGMARASKDGDWSETYICDLIDWHLKEQETMDWLTGTAYWPFKDFSTPVRPENPVPYMNQKGVVERDLTPKESYYVFQSYWTDEPMVHIYGHSWPVRWGYSGEEKIIKVYSNCNEVELFLNGVSLGKKKRNSQDFPAAGLRWTSEFKKGKNTLKAVTTKGKIMVVDEINFEYNPNYNPSQKEIKIKATIVEEADDYVWIEAELQDVLGTVCFNSQKYVSFESIGKGNLVQNMGTSTGSKKVQVCNGRARIKLMKNRGQSIVTVKSEGLETQFVPVNHITKVDL